MLPTLVRLLGEPEQRPATVVVPTPAVERAPAVADAYVARVLVASARERAAAARDGGPIFAIVLAQVDRDAVDEATRRAILHRAIPATLGGTATALGGASSAD